MSLSTSSLLLMAVPLVCEWFVNGREISRGTSWVWIAGLMGRGALQPLHVACVVKLFDWLIDCVSDTDRLLQLQLDLGAWKSHPDVPHSSGAGSGSVCWWGWFSLHCLRRQCQWSTQIAEVCKKFFKTSINWSGIRREESLKYEGHSKKHYIPDSSTWSTI